MKHIPKLIAAMCGTGALLGCTTNRLLPEMAILPAMQVRHSHESAHGYYTVGRYYHGAKQLEKALNAYRQCLELEPGHIDARNAMAVILAERGEYERAADVLQVVVQTAPDASYLFSNLGYVYLLKGEYEKALPALQKAVTLDTTNARARNNLASVMEKMGQLGNARRMAAEGKKASGAASTVNAIGYGREQRHVAMASAATDVTNPAALESPADAGDKVTDQGPRVEIREIVPGIYESKIVRAEKQGDPGAMLAAEKSSVPAAESRPPARLEISNGNGVTGMAKTIAAIVNGRGALVVRLTNQPTFRVPSTRIEYKEGHERAARTFAQGLGMPVTVEQSDIGARADVRLILGRDMLDVKLVRKNYLDWHEASANREESRS